jgi:hypothetical protein
VNLPDVTLLADVTISHPSNKTWRQVTAKRSVEAVGDTREAEKDGSYTSLAAENDMLFKAIVLYTYGGFHRSALAFIKQLADALDPHSCLLTRAEWLRALKAHIAIAVQRGNADIMIQAAQRSWSGGHHDKGRRRAVRHRRRKRRCDVGQGNGAHTPRAEEGDTTKMKAVPAGIGTHLNHAVSAGSLALADVHMAADGVAGGGGNPAGYVSGVSVNAKVLLARAAAVSAATVCMADVDSCCVPIAPSGQTAAAAVRSGTQFDAMTTSSSATYCADNVAVRPETLTVIVIDGCDGVSTEGREGKGTDAVCRCVGSGSVSEDGGADTVGMDLLPICADGVLPLTAECRL